MRGKQGKPSWRLSSVRTYEVTRILRRANYMLQDIDLAEVTLTLGYVCNDPSDSRSSIGEGAMKHGWIGYRMTSRESQESTFANPAQPHSVFVSSTRH